jgi:hypothetical protein
MLKEIHLFSTSGSPGFDQDFAFKSFSCVRNITLEFNAVFKSGLGIEIRQLNVEILLLFHHKPSEITIFRKKSDFGKYLD